MLNLLIANPLLLLFSVAGLGYFLGSVKVKGFSLGVAAVLFVGLFIGSMDAQLRLPDVIYQLGLLLFVYTVGLSSGLDFVQNLRQRGSKDMLVVGGVIVMSAIIASIVEFTFRLRPELVAGLFAGSLTSTPALAGVIETIGLRAGPDAQQTATAVLQTLPVVGYSVAYPISVLGMMIVIVVMKRVLKTDSPEAKQEDLARLREYGISTEALYVQTIRITKLQDGGEVLGELRHKHNLSVIFGRLLHEGQLSLCSAYSILRNGDQVSVTGDRELVMQAQMALGELSDERLDLERDEFDVRRVFVSNSEIAGRTLEDLNLRKSYGAIITRIRRGDLDFLPNGKTVLQLGDRVRVVAQRHDMEKVSDYFGDSYRHASEVDVLAFGLGIALGLLLGVIPIPLPGGVTIKLGVAGGPLLVALVLGALQRTGGLVWTVPYSANQTLRQIGLVFFLAGIGVNSGFAFVNTIAQGGALPLLIGAVAIVVVSGVAMLWLAHRYLRLPYGVALGMLAGMQTQPAVLSFAANQTDDDVPNTGYAAAFPVAMVLKIILAQALLFLPR
jgi:putative transport protein